jgi:hypothetical protein
MINGNDDANTTHNRSQQFLSLTSSLSLLIENIDLLKNIVYFVGINQYRFVAGISSGFRDAYVQVFP